MPRNKTREEKIKTSYRLTNFKLASEARQEVKDMNAFEYLDSKYVKKDLAKTVLVSAFMIAAILFAKNYFG